MQNYLGSNKEINITLSFTGTTFSHSAAFVGGNYTAFPGLNSTPLATRMLAVPKFKNEFDHLIRNYTTELVNADTMNPRIDDLMTFLNDDVVWDKALPRLGSLEYASFMPENLTIADIPLSIGVNGPVPSLMTVGLREWVVNRSKSLYEYFNETAISNI